MESSAAVWSNVFQMRYFKEHVMDGSCSTYGGRRNAYKILVGRSEGKSPRG